MTGSVGIREVRAAAGRLHGIARVTPVVGSDRVVAMRLKCENLQRSRAFKFRGIFNRMALLSEQERASGVVIVSSGNAGLATAVAGRILGITCTVAVAASALESKLAAIRAAGASVVVVDGDADTAFAEAERLRDDRRLTMIHAFDDPDVIAGQGTIALELLDQAPDLDCLIVPTSGGSMLAGSVVTLSAERPDVRLIGVEAEGTTVLRESLRVGRVTPRETAHSIADGLVYRGYGALNFEIVRAHGAVEVVVVDDDEILRAMATGWREFGVAMEPAAATALAGAMSAGVADSAGTVAVISGGNVDLELLRHALAGGTARDWLRR